MSMFQAGGAAEKKVTIITGVAKKKVDPSKRKGELMESNMDAMEYSSEEEEEDLDSAMAGLNKQKRKVRVSILPLLNPSIAEATFAQSTRKFEFGCPDR